MSCVLHFYGDHADVDELVRLCPVDPVAVFRKGQPRTTRPSAYQARTSGVNIVASDADFDFLAVQQSEALPFLTLHQTKLQAMREVAGVEAASIDFGISMRNVIVQSDSFEPHLLARIASLGMSLVLSQYPPAGRAKKIKQYRRALRRTA